MSTIKKTVTDVIATGIFKGNTNISVELPLTELDRQENATEALKGLMALKSQEQELQSIVKRLRAAIKNLKEDISAIVEEEEYGFRLQEVTAEKYVDTTTGAISYVYGDKVVKVDSPNLLDMPTSSEGAEGEDELWDEDDDLYEDLDKDDFDGEGFDEEEDVLDENDSQLPTAENDSSGHLKIASNE